MVASNYKTKEIFSWPSIDAKTSAATLLFTTENGSKNFYVTNIYVESVAAAGITVAASVSVGTNSTSYNNIVALAVLTGLTGSGNHTTLTLMGIKPVVAPNTPIYVNVGVPAIGTSQTLSMHVEGFYGL